MPRETLHMLSRQVQVDYPADWFVSGKCVPKLVIPRELFAISNRPIKTVPRSSSQPRPMIASLDRGAVVLWAYFQIPDDPTPELEGGIPDYRGFSYPFEYAEAEVFAGHNAREWKASDFIWKRLGWGSSNSQFTLWIWEGVDVRPQVVQSAREIVGSVRIS